MYMEEAANFICYLQETLTEIDTVVANVNERRKRTILHIETAARRLVQTVIEHRQKLVSKVCAITEARLRALHAEKESVQGHFRAVGNVLRCVQNTGAVEDSREQQEWQDALSRHLGDLKGQVFDFQEYDEDLKFQFLYRDENLLAAICKFGEVFTIANGSPREEKDERSVASPGTKAAVIEHKKDDIEPYNNIVTTGNVDSASSLMAPGNQNAVTETKFVRQMPEVFDETVDVIRLAEERKDSIELNKDNKAQFNIHEGISDATEEDEVWKGVIQDGMDPVFVSSSVDAPDEEQEVAKAEKVTGEGFSDIILNEIWSSAMDFEKPHTLSGSNDNDNGLTPDERKSDFCVPDSTNKREVFSAAVKKPTDLNE